MSDRPWKEHWWKHDHSFQHCYQPFCTYTSHEIPDFSWSSNFWSSETEWESHLLLKKTHLSKFLKLEQTTWKTHYKIHLTLTRLFFPNTTHLQYCLLQLSHLISPDIIKTSVIIFNWYKRNTKIDILIYIPIDVKLQNHLRCQFVRRNSIQGGHNTPSCLPIQE